MHHALLKALLKPGLDLNDIQGLAETHVFVDPDAAPLRAALEQETSTERVLRDQRQAHDLLTAVRLCYLV